MNRAGTLPPSMGKDQKTEFVRQLCSNIAESVVTQINRGSLPEEWDGVELRHLLKLHFADAASIGHLTGSRRRDFNNTINVRNLI